MKTWAYVDSGRVIQLYETEDDRDIHEFFHPEMLWINVDDVSGISAGWSATETEAAWIFTEYVPPAPTPEEVKTANSSMRDTLLTLAALAIAPLQDAEDLEESTPDEVAALKKWKQYRVAINRVELTQQNLTWPSAPF